MPSRQRPVIGHHLIWTLYGHWLANDPRGSGSEAVRDPKFAQFGEAHFGRKPQRETPTRQALRNFYRHAAPMLEFPRFWIDGAKRQVLADAIGDVVRKRPYTVWACAILSNHVHMVIRRHGDDALTIWQSIADASRQRLQMSPEVGNHHPVWAARPYKVFLSTPAEVRSRIDYVECNPEKEGLPRQRFDFVTSYDGWTYQAAFKRPR